LLVMSVQSDGKAKKASTGTASAVQSKDKSEGGGLSPMAILFLLVAIACGVYFTQVQN